MENDGTWICNPDPRDEEVFLKAHSKVYDMFKAWQAFNDAVVESREQYEEVFLCEYTDEYNGLTRIYMYRDGKTARYKEYYNFMGGYDD